MEERTTVRLPRDLLSRARRKAAAEGRTLTALIADGVRMVLADRRLSPPVKRILPPVSKAGGGLLPGVDLADSRALQASEDLDYARRLTHSP